jgi:hypothetical protein
VEQTAIHLDGDRLMRPGKHAGKPVHGAWLPWDLALAIGRLNLKPPSRWQVFLAILLPWARFGEAWLTVGQICERTGLRKRAAQAALSDLIALGVVKRVGRYGRLVVVPEAITTRTRNSEPRRDDDGLPDRHHGRRYGDLGRGPSRPAPANREEATFTQKQRKLIGKCFADATELLGEDARRLSVPESVATKLGLEPPVSYGQAYLILERDGRCAACGCFVRAVLDLLTDERVQGRELDLSICEGPVGIRENVGSITTKQLESIECPIADGPELHSEHRDVPGHQGGFAVQVAFDAADLRPIVEAVVAERADRPVANDSYSTTEVARTLDEDACKLLIPEREAAAPGPEPLVVDGHAYDSLDHEACRETGRSIVGVLVKTQTRKRVQGRELELANPDSTHADANNVAPMPDRQVVECEA